MAVNFKSENIQKYKDLSDSIKSNLEAKNSIITEKEPHLAYYNNLPEGITKKEAEELSKYNSKFVTAAHVAVGELAADMFKGDKSLEAVEAKIGYFGKSDNINITVFKEKTYQNHLAKDGEPKEVTKHLVMSTSIDTISAKGYGLKAVRDSMTEEFSNMFKR